MSYNKQECPWSGEEDNMYEKYTGLPDTARSARGNAGRGSSSAGNTDRINRDAYEYGDDGYRRSSSQRSASGRSRNSRRKQQLRRKRMLVGISSLVLIGLLIVAIVVIAKSCNATGNDTVPIADVSTGSFRAGVFINGTDVSGKTMDEVRQSLADNDAYAINNIAITLEGDGFSKTISGADMNVTTNLEEVMTNAMTGGANQVYYTTLTLDDGSLAARIDEINASLSSPPTDATFTVKISDSGKPTFEYADGKAGTGIDVEATAQLVNQAFAAGQYQTTIHPQLTTVQPSVTVADIQAHTALIGSYTTTYDFKGTAEDTEEQRLELIPNRAYNVEKCASLINNQVVKPGRTWSFNDTVGDRNEKNGWREANGIFGGDRFSRQFGGGVCQVSTTLYNALLECYSNIQIVTRSSHTIPSTYVLKGLDATVDTGHIDFKFKNTSEYPLYIFAYVSKNKKASSRKRDITVSIYGEALPAGTTYQPYIELKEEVPAGEPVVTESKKYFVGEEVVTAEARSKYVLDVYIERLLNGELQERIYMYTDTYPGNPEKRTIGTKPTPTPEPTATPVPTPSPNPEDQP